MTDDMVKKVTNHTDTDTMRFMTFYIRDILKPVPVLQDDREYRLRTTDVPRP